MVDPTSDHEENVDPEDAPECAVCGDPIANEPTHRVVTWLENGTVHAAHFCGDDCRDDWDRPA